MSRLLLASLALLVCACSADPIETVVNPDTEGPLGAKLGVDERIAIAGLSAPVDAVRDAHGRTHIYAVTMEDAVRAQGYLIARDRAIQIELLRRLSSGRLAEWFGSQVASDVTFRHLGLQRAGQQSYDRADDELKALLDAFADGVSQLFAKIRSGEHENPPSPAGFSDPELFTDFTGADSLTIGRLQSFLLSYSGDEEMDDTELFDDLRATFNQGADAEALKKRAGIERDVMRFEPPDHATTVDGLPQDPSQGATSTRSADWSPPASPAAQRDRAGHRRRSAELLRRSGTFREAIRQARKFLAPTGDFGSNNWAVAPDRSSRGVSMVASDPHLGLSSPSTFWPVSIHVDGDGASDLHVGGVAFPGIPGIILGHNRHIAWGATVAGYDVTDVYQETLTADGESVMFNGKPVALQTIEEVITTAGGDTITYPVKVVPHHGPIVPTLVDGAVQPLDPEVGALSVRWTGFEPSDEILAVVRLLRATDVDEARAALDNFSVGAQNWMIGDSSGNILWTSHAQVPYREPAALDWDPASYDGLLPCFVLPGQGGAEWDGMWADDAVPWAKNPAAFFLATANQDPVGTTVDNDPSNDVQSDGSSGFLSCSFARGFRQATIQGRLQHNGGLVTLEDMSSIQGDVRSPLGRRLVPGLLLAIDRAQQAVPYPTTQPDLADIVKEPGYANADIPALRSALAAWGSEHDYQAASGVDPDTGTSLPAGDPEVAPAQVTLLFNAWLVRFLARTFADEMALVGKSEGSRHDLNALLHLVTSDPTTLATYDPATGDSSLWDDLATEAIESRHERMIRALIDALAWLDEQVPGGFADYRWGQFHTVRFEGLAAPFNALAIPSFQDETFADGFPRPGDMYAVDASNFSLTQALDDDLDFTYASGPTQRFVVELHPSGPVARNALPGGAVWDETSPYFANQAEEWRRNQVHDVPFAENDVLAAADSRTVLSSP